MHTWNRNISIRVKSTNRPFTLVPYEHGFHSLKAVFSLPEWNWKLWKCMQTLYAGATEDQIATWSQAKESSPRMPWHQAYKITKKENQENLLGKWKFSTPFKFSMWLGAQRRCTKMLSLKVAALLLPWQQRLLVRGLKPHFHTKTSQKMIIFLSQAK